MDPKSSQNSSGFVCPRWTSEEIRLLLSEVKRDPLKYFGPLATTQNKVDAWADVSDKLHAFGAVEGTPRTPSRCEKKFYSFRSRTRKKVNKIVESGRSKGLNSIELESMHIFEEIDRKLDQIYGEITNSEDPSISDGQTDSRKKGRRKRKPEEPNKFMSQGNPHGDILLKFYQTSSAVRQKYARSNWQHHRRLLKAAKQKIFDDTSQDVSTKQHDVVVLCGQDGQQNNAQDSRDSSRDFSKSSETAGDNSSGDSSGEDEAGVETTYVGLENTVANPTPMGVLPKAVKVSNVHSFTEQESDPLQDLSSSFQDINGSMEYGHSEEETDNFEENRQSYGRRKETSKVEDRILSTLQELLTIQRERLKIEREKLKLKRMKLEILKSSQ